MAKEYLDGHRLTAEPAETMSWVSSPEWQDSIPKLPNGFEPGKTPIIYPIFEKALQTLQRPGLLTLNINEPDFCYTDHYQRDEVFVTYENKHTFPGKPESLKFQGTENDIQGLARETGLLSLIAL